MKYLLVVLSFILSSTIAANEEIARRSDQYSSSQERSQKKDEGFLFIFHAKDAHLQSIDNDTYKLTFYHVDKTVTYFTDRPERKAGKMSMSQFLRGWDMGKNSFRKVKPNAGLVSFSGFSGKNQFDDIPVILSDPQYEQQHDRLTFHVTPIEKNQKIPTGDLGESTLFVDATIAIFQQLP